MRLTLAEAIETTHIHSVAGLTGDSVSVWLRCLWHALAMTQRREEAIPRA
jgi:hypothetical protein